MAEKSRVESATRHPLIEKVLALKPAVAELIGFNVEEISGGRAVGYLQAGPQHANPMGTMHGGVLCDLADAAMGMAFASTLAPLESFRIAEHQLLSPRVASATACGSPRSEPRAESGLYRM